MKKILFAIIVLFSCLGQAYADCRISARLKLETRTAFHDKDLTVLSEARSGLLSSVRKSKDAEQISCEARYVQKKYQEAREEALDENLFRIEGEKTEQIDKTMRSIKEALKSPAYKDIYTDGTCIRITASGVKASDGTERRSNFDWTCINIKAGTDISGDMTAVLLHEYAHVLFTRLSNEKQTEFKDIGGKKERDYASKYGMTSHYEDFAEFAVLFAFHNGRLVEMTKTNALLKKKYDFVLANFPTYLAYVGTDFSTEDTKFVKSVPFDMTKVSFDEDKFAEYETSK